MNFDVNLGTIPVEASDTDETLLQKSRNHLPTALRKLGEKAGEEAWNTLKQEFRGNSFLTFDDSYSAKSGFIRSAQEQFVNTTSTADRDNIVQTVFEQLKQQRDAKR